MATTVKPSRFISYSVECTVPNKAEILYTCPANCRAIMSLLFVSNGNGITDVSLTWWRENGTQHIIILGAKNFSSSDFIKFDGAFIVFEPGDYMTITPTNNTTPHIDALCTVEEIFIPVG